MVLGAGPAHAFYFSTYEFTKEKLTELKINDNINYSEWTNDFVIELISIDFNGLIL